MRTLFTLFFQFFKRDLLIMKEEYLSKFFDTCFVFFTNVIVFSYFMKNQGLSEEYGPFLMVGAIASFGLFEVVTKVSKLIEDIEGAKTISFLLTLPLSANALFIYTGVYYALYSALFTLPLFLFGKILLFNRFDLLDISYWRLVLIFLTSNLFYGFFALWLTGIIRGSGEITSIFLRFINPLFMFGAYFFTWQNAYALDHLIGYAILINPMVYVMEGIRSAALGNAGYIPFWITPLALWGFILLLGYLGIQKIKKRIDCV